MKRSLFLAKMAIVLAFSLLGAFLFPRLPDIVPVHWNFAGNPDGFAGKSWVVSVFPMIMVVMLGLFQAIPRLDPNKENYPKFEKAWEAFQFALLLFFGYAYSVMLFASLDPAIPLPRLVLAGTWVLFAVIGNYMGKIRQNYFVGIRLPWTLASEDVWNKTHRFGGKMFMLAWVLFLVQSISVFVPVATLVGVVLCVTIAPVAFAYSEFRRGRKGSAS